MRKLPARIWLAAMLLAAASGPALAHGKLVMKVDSVSAAMERHALVIVAKGAVRSGGWDDPRLRIGGTGGGVLTVRFVATPPARDETVIQAVVPVSATLRAQIRPGSIQRIKVIAESNDMSVSVSPR